MFSQKVKFGFYGLKWMEEKMISGKIKWSWITNVSNWFFFQFIWLSIIWAQIIYAYMAGPMFKTHVVGSCDVSKCTLETSHELFLFWFVDQCFRIDRLVIQHLVY
jgi:hypothetical protein